MEQLTSSEVPIGAILAGKYRVDRLLGAGGMGVVLAAHHLQLDELVAIKMLLPSMLEHREAVERFSREARAAVKIKSEHVARVIDVGTLDSGAPYMVMEYLDGEDLGQWVETRGALPVEQAVEFVLQASEAIAEAHALGIVHRDIKPSNLFCVRRADGLLSVKVLDFGISKFSSAPTDLGMTKTQTVMGSPHYMSPEQLLSAKNADAQSDIWSLGAVLYQLLTAHVPFEAETFPELILKVSGTDAAPASSLRPDVPAALSDVALRCLARDREQRYKSIAELAVALVPFGPPRRAEHSAERILRVLEQGGGTGRASSVSLAAAVAGSRRPLETASRLGTRGSDATQLGPASPVTGRTVGTFANTMGTGPSRSRVWALGALALVLVAVGAVTAGIWLQGSSSAESAAGGVRAADPTEPRTTAPETAPVQPSRETPSSAVPSGAAPSSAATPSPAAAGAETTPAAPAPASEPAQPGPSAPLPAERDPRPAPVRGAKPASRPGAPSGTKPAPAKETPGDANSAFGGRE